MTQLSSRPRLVVGVGKESGVAASEVAVVAVVAVVAAVVVVVVVVAVAMEVTVARRLAWTEARLVVPRAAASPSSEPRQRLLGQHPQGRRSPPLLGDSPPLGGSRTLSYYRCYLHRRA